MRKFLPIILSALCVVVVAWALPQRSAAGQRNDVPVDCEGRKPMTEDRPRTTGDRVRRFLLPWQDESDENTGKRSGKYAVPENASSGTVPQMPQQSSSQEPAYLKEIASILSIPVSDKDTPGDIVFKIRQRIDNPVRYRGKVLSDESFGKVKSAIWIRNDAETFAEYHAFIKKVEGKKIVILDCKE